MKPSKLFTAVIFALGVILESTSAQAYTATCNKNTGHYTCTGIGCTRFFKTVLSIHKADSATISTNSTFFGISYSPIVTSDQYSLTVNGQTFSSATTDFRVDFVDSGAPRLVVLQSTTQAQLLNIAIDLRAVTFTDNVTATSMSLAAFLQKLGTR